MRNRPIVLALMACFCFVAFGHSNTANNSTNMTEDDFRKLEQNWLDAASVPDLPALRRVFADDFMGTSFGDGVLNKRDVIPTQAAGANHMPKCMLRDSTVRIFGDTAVLMGVVEMQIPHAPEQIRMTTVFQQRPGGWQVIAVHMSKLSKATA